MTSETSFTDCMVDIETTGRNPDRAAILQIGAVRFNLDGEVIDTADMFNRCLRIPPTRFWEESTRNWWLDQKQETLQWILDNAEPPELVMKDFFDWSIKYPNLRFWAKPTHFDYSFMSSYFSDFAYINPYHYRSARDVNSWVEARYYPDPVPKVEEADFGAAHNALNDCFYQLDFLFKHYEGTKKCQPENCTTT